MQLVEGEPPHLYRTKSGQCNGTIAIEQAFNPAGAVIVLDPSGTIPVRYGDTLFSGQVFDFVYAKLPGLSVELQHKLEKHRPATLAQAAQIDGITPSALMLVLAHVKKAARAAPSTDSGVTLPATKARV